VLPRLKIYSAKARLRELKAEMLENRLREQEEKLDVAAAMGWHDEAEDEADENAKWVLVSVVAWRRGGVVVGCACIMGLSAKQTMRPGKCPGHPSVIPAALSRLLLCQQHCQEPWHTPLRGGG
jgi:hypothetical protein